MSMRNASPGGLGFRSASSPRGSFARVEECS
jgi:hypothetical protein